MKQYITVKNMAIAALILVVILLSAYSYSQHLSIGKKIAESIEQATEKMQKENEAQIKSKDDEIKIIESRLVELRTKLSASELKYRVAIQKIADLEREKLDVKVPQSSSERRDRFSTAGFPMLPLKK